MYLPYLTCRPNNEPKRSARMEGEAAAKGVYLPYLTCRPNNDPKRGATVEGEAAKGVGCGRGGLRMGC